ncbi:MAG: ABC transporter substrate-binding protein [Lactobacillus sp.]|nr:MAG: ABC transporter substrate-binding protein [Lactobacillus sp.]
MIRLRRVLTLSLCLLVAVFTLSGCGQQHQSSSARVKITFWHGMVGAHKTALNKIIRDFNQSQSKYKVVGVSQGNFSNVQQKITAAAKSHTLPTIAQTTYTNVPDYVKGGFITSFDPYISSADLSDIYPAFRQSIKYQGKSYAMPFSKSAQILYYNQDLLKKLNLSVPTTWEEMQKDSAIAKQQGYAGTVFDQSFISQLDGLSRQAGTTLMTSTPKKQFNVAKVTTATHVIWDMLQNGSATTAGSDGYGDVPFLKGKTLFYTGSSAALAFMQSSTPKGMHWNTTPLPSYQGKQATSIAGNDIVMFKSASKQQRQGAAAFVKYLMSTKQTIRWAKASGYVPLTKSAQKNKSYQAYLTKHPYDQAALKSLDFGFQDRSFLGYNQYYSAVGKAISKMATDHQTPEKTLPTLKQQLVKIVKSNQ